MLEMRPGKAVKAYKSVRPLHGHLEGNEGSRRAIRRLNPGTDSSPWVQDDTQVRTNHHVFVQCLKYSIYTFCGQGTQSYLTKALHVK